MRWNTQDIEKALVKYNAKYFDNAIKGEITVVWSRQLYNVQFNNRAIKESGAEATMSTKEDGSHTLKLNTSLYNASPALMKNTIVHEMIHAWQGEYEEEIEGDWHDDVFLEWCDKLNKTGDFKYPLSPTATFKEDKAYNRTNKSSAYYIYKMTEGENGEKFPIGVFLNFLYLEEYNWLIHKGFEIKYYKHLKPGPNANSFIKNKLCNFNEFFLKISDFKKYKLTPDNFVQIVFDELGKNKVFCDDEFNYESGE